MAYPDTLRLRVEIDTFFIEGNATEVNGVFEVFPVTDQMSTFRARPENALYLTRIHQRTAQAWIETILSRHALERIGQRKAKV